MECSGGSTLGLPRGRVLIEAASVSHDGSGSLTPHSSMFQGLLRLRDLGFSPTSILDVGAYESQFSRGVAANLEGRMYIYDRRPCWKESRCFLIAMLGEREMEAASFFVVDTELRPDPIW